MTNIKSMPVKLLPAFKDYLWGGTRLKTDFNKKTDLDIVAESWELSANEDGQSVVTGGEYDGYTLREYIGKVGKEVLGSKARDMTYFPLLIKLIDAKTNLSVQVHPDDVYAGRVENSYGKTEMWYVLDCEPGAYLYYGLNRAISKEEFKERIDNNTILDVLNKAEVHKGSVFFIPSGTIHAIGAGIVICEIQQNSNITYRVYDYDRRDKDGRPRELHIDKALDVTDLKKAPELTQIQSDDDAVLASCKYFTVRRLRVKGKAEVGIDDTSFHSLIVTDGSGYINMNDTKTELNKGDSIFVPAQSGKYVLNGDLEIVLSRI